MPLNGDITFFAETTFRNLRKRFGIKTDDRRRHIYVIGKTGMGKTEMLANMVIQDIQRGFGVAVVDPHGEFSERMLDYVPAHRVNDVVYFNPADMEYPIAFNVMENVRVEHRHLVASGLMGVFKKIWPDVWSARMEYILNNAILALLEYPGATLLGAQRMLSDKEFRSKVVEKITDPVVKSFWVNEFARYTQRLEAEATASIQNKIGQFISNPLIRDIVGQVKSKLDMREIMDSGKILIINLAKGKVGEDNSRLLGAMLVTKLQLAAMSRVDVPEEERRDFFLYVDEFQNFATESFANILSEARKYRLSLVLAHQYVAQLDEHVADAVFGNVGTIISFRIGAEDAEMLEKEFAPEFMASDLVNLGKFNIYLKLMIEGITGPAFSAITLPPAEKPEKSYKDSIIKVSRERYGTERHSVDEKITRWWEGAAFSSKAGEVRPPQEPPRLWEAECWKCKKRTNVIFEPDGKRPVYCKKCLKEVRESSQVPASGIAREDRFGPAAYKPQEERPARPIRPYEPEHPPVPRKPQETGIRQSFSRPESFPPPARIIPPPVRRAERGEKQSLTERRTGFQRQFKEEPAVNSPGQTMRLEQISEFQTVRPLRSADNNKPLKPKQVDSPPGTEYRDNNSNDNNNASGVLRHGDTISF